MDRYKRPLWLGMLITGTIVITVKVLLMAIVVLPIALRAEQDLLALGDFSQMVLLERGASGDAQSNIESVKDLVAPAAHTSRWIARLSSTVAWFPGLDHEVYAWALQMDRLENDLALASDLLEASSDLLASYESVGLALVDVGAKSDVPRLQQSVAELEAIFLSASILLDDAQGYRLWKPGLRLPRLSQALGALVEGEDRMQFAAQVGLSGSRLLVDLLAVGESIRPLVGLFADRAINDSPVAYDELVVLLRDLGTLVDSTTQQSADLADLIEKNGQILDLQTKLADLQLVVGVLQNIVVAVSTTLEILDPVLQSEGTGLFDEGGTIIAAVEALNDRLGDVAGAVSQLEKAKQVLRDVSLSGAGATGLNDLVVVADSLHDGLRLLVDMAPLGLELLGAQGTQRYLILGQSADELRATGGFVSALWLVTIENGALLDVRYHDTVRVDDWDRLELYPPAPAGLTAHMNAKVWLLRDVSWEPDFPTVAKTATDMYMIGQRQAVDGVIAINQWTLHSLLGALGSIVAPSGSGEITPNNLFNRLEQGSDEFGRAYTDLALQGILEKLNKPLSLGSFVKVASAVQSSLNSRDLMVYTEDDQLQEQLMTAGWDGGLGGRGTDYLYVVDSNVGWSKADRNIQRRLRYQIDLRKEPGARASLTLDYTNHSGPGSPGCEPQWLNRGTNYTQLKNACYWDFWRVYTPLGSRVLSNTPLELPLYSVSAEIDEGLPGEDTFNISSSYNRNVMSGLFALGAGEQTQFTMVYDLPSDVVSRSGDQIEYELLVQKQPGNRGSEMTLELVLPTGYRLVSSSIPPTFSEDHRIGFHFRIQQDMVFSAVLNSNDESN